MKKVVTFVTTNNTTHRGHGATTTAAYLDQSEPGLKAQAHHLLPLIGVSHPETEAFEIATNGELLLLHRDAHVSSPLCVPRIKVGHQTTAMPFTLIVDEGG